VARRTLPELDQQSRRRLFDRVVRRDDAEQDEFLGREQEMAAYLERARGRLATTLEHLRRLIGRGEPRVLEVGADPWFFTQLLVEDGLRPVSTGKRAGVWAEDDRDGSPQRLTIAWGGRTAVLEHHLFNAERDPWPFGEASFDVVLCVDVLEHLVYSPAHLLYEASRVLTSNGALLLATPNGLAATRLAKLLRGRSADAPYSGYGAGGRHNRLFTAGEVAVILEHAGFDADVKTANLAGYEADDRTGGALRALAGLQPASLGGRGDQIFALALRARPPALSFPAALYRGFDRDRMRAQGVFLPDEREP
jgi:SAM-dependent methyltransferase